MAIYMLSAKIIGRSSGGNAVAAAAYRAGERLEGERCSLDEAGKMTRSREVFDYTNKGGVVDSFIVAPENASQTLTERQSLWQAVEQGERRKDAQLAREMILALPRELTLQANAELVREFVTDELVSRGMIADVAIHNPMASDGKSNPHAHVMLTMRELSDDGESFGKKAREWNAAFGNTAGQGSKGGVTASDGLQSLRERWAGAINSKLAAADVLARVSHLSNEAQGLEREPQPKLGKHWHGNTDHASTAHAERDAVRNANTRNGYLRKRRGSSAARSQNQAQELADIADMEAALKRGYYRSPDIEPPDAMERWQYGIEQMASREPEQNPQELER